MPTFVALSLLLIEEMHQFYPTLWHRLVRDVLILIMQQLAKAVQIWIVDLAAWGLSYRERLQCLGNVVHIETVPQTVRALSAR